MAFTETRTLLTHEGALAMVQAAIAQADAIGVPQCIIIVDQSGESIAEMRMTGAKFLSLRSARAKAVTAASTGAPSGSMPEAVRLSVSIVTDGKGTGLPGGLPIRINGELVGGIGVGSGSPEEDLDVARHALAVIGADLA